MATDSTISRVEHDEFVKRIEERDRRQERRIELLEADVKNLEKVNISIEKLASNMENMLKEQIRLGDRIEVLESRDGELWRKVTGYALTAIIGIIIGFIFKQIGM